MAISNIWLLLPGVVPQVLRDDVRLRVEVIRARRNRRHARLPEQAVPVVAEVEIFVRRARVRLVQAEQLPGYRVAVKE